MKHDEIAKSPKWENGPELKTKKLKKLKLETKVSLCHSKYKNIASLFLLFTHLFVIKDKTKTIDQNH